MLFDESCCLEQIAAKHSRNNGESYWRGRLRVLRKEFDRNNQMDKEGQGFGKEEEL